MGGPGVGGRAGHGWGGHCVHVEGKKMYTEDVADVYEDVEGVMGGEKRVTTGQMS